MVVEESRGGEKGGRMGGGEGRGEAGGGNFFVQAMCVSLGKAEEVVWTAV